MDFLTQNLLEQQLELEHLRIYNHENMNNANVGKPPLSPPRKYVSVFRINGEPILPPLMTTEKRREMQKIKEKALKIEKFLSERKQGLHDEYYHYHENMKRTNSSNSINQTQRSQDNSESKITEEESIILLQNLLQRQQQRAEEAATEKFNHACNVAPHFHNVGNQEKLRKLQKSELIIYDNCTNEVVQVLAEKKKMIDDQGMQLRELDCQSNFNLTFNKKRSHLLLAGVNDKGMTAIPSICLNPPTPLMLNKSLCDALSGTESNDSLMNSENIKHSLNFGKHLSSDESFDSMITQSDQKSNTNTSQHNNKLDGKDLNPVKNVSAKIQQFEAISSETCTPQTSPEKLYKSRNRCLGTPTGGMNRSATSPSIKISSRDRSCSPRSQSLAQESDNSPENAIVRSSSFTLEGPSKVLIQHMQQQKVISNYKSAVKSSLNVTQNVSKKVSYSPLRAHRDTVESKAKKVQKVDLKSSKQKILQKNSQSKLAQAVTASIIPGSTTNPTQHVNKFLQTKRSPYDIPKSSHTNLQILNRTISPQIHKSNSTSCNSVQKKTLKSRLTKSSTSTSSNSPGIPKNCKDSLHQMDKAQKQKILQLLAAQAEEHRRLQESFERQQNLLIQQLSREMAVTQMKSPTNSNNSLPITPTSQQKALTSQQMWPSPQLGQINCNGFLDHGLRKPSSPSYNPTRHKTPPNKQQSSSSISNNNSYLSFDKPQSQSFLNSPSNSSYASHCPPPPQSNHLNNSHLSIMDHSNANTSLDVSTLSTQTSPDNLYVTPMQNNTACNTVCNNTTSSSRRRLFPEEISGERLGVNAARSPYTSSKSFLEHANQSQKINHINGSNKREQSGNSLILHAAATKINAYVRGFLVRRLFQTEQVQRIVQTIRDTLIFVLNLHIETIADPKELQSPANIKLKARLLQQLSSACRSLHLIFFQTTIKDRMEIIARDRKRIKTKLLSMSSKRSAKIVG